MGLIEEIKKLRELEQKDLRPIPHMPGYMVSALGDVWSFTNWRGKGPRKLKSHMDNYGYLRVRIEIEGNPTRRCSKGVHRIVCEAFHGEPINRLQQVRHLNGIKTDNRAENLAWGTAKDNAIDRRRHGHDAVGEKNGESKLTEEVLRAAKIFRDFGMSTEIMAAYIGVTDGCLRSALHGRSWKCINVVD